MNKIIEWLFPKQKTDLEVVLGYISKYGVQNALDTDPIKDQHFNVGSFELQFGYDDEEAIFKYKGDLVPMFIFEGDNVDLLRHSVIGTHNSK